MGKKPFKNRTLGGRLIIRDFVTASVMAEFTCFFYDSWFLLCVLLHEIERGENSLQSLSLLSSSSLCPSLSSKARIIAHKIYVVLVRDTFAICKSNQTYIGLRISARTCQRKISAQLTRRNTRDISSSLGNRYEKSVELSFRNYFEN